MRNIAQRLIAEEYRSRDPSDSEARAAFRVCEKLRAPLALVLGVTGFQSLLSRAHALAKQEVASLQGLQINPDGTLHFSPALQSHLATKEGLRGGSVLLAQLLGLLFTFIGEGLTLRLMRDIWPKAALDSLKSEKPL